MRTIRIFAKTGQGLFSVERHCGCTIVYDCGGENVPSVENAIPHILQPNEPIIALFISHYDRDHINGIPFLLSYCDVRHIFLPMVKECVKELTLQELSSKSFEHHFINNPEAAIGDINRGRDVQIHYIEPQEGTEDVRDTDNLNEIENDPILIDNIRKGQNFKSGTAFTLYPNSNWIYKPFNRQLMTSQQWQSFITKLNLPANATCDDVLNYWKSNKKGVKQIIKQAWSDATGINETLINAYSMTLYTGCKKRHRGNGCLFTGDYDAKQFMSELKNAYKSLWDNISIVQIPHHGSGENFNDDLIIPDGVHIIPNCETPKTSKGVDANAQIAKIKSKRKKLACTWQKDCYVICGSNYYPWRCAHCCGNCYDYGDCCPCCDGAVLL